MHVLFHFQSHMLCLCTTTCYAFSFIWSIIECKFFNKFYAYTLGTPFYQCELKIQTLKSKLRQTSSVHSMRRRTTHGTTVIWFDKLSSFVYIKNKSFMPQDSFLLFKKKTLHWILLNLQDQGLEKFPPFETCKIRIC